MRKTNSSTLIAGHLEIQHDRGVVYFHAISNEVEQGACPTPLRIQGLRPIPKEMDKGHQIDCQAWHDSNFEDQCRTVQTNDAEQRTSS